MKYFLLTILSVIFALPAVSQTKEWTMQQCMQYAVENNPRVHKQNATNSSLHQDYLEAIGRFLPSIQGSTTSGMNFGRALGEDNTYTDLNTFSQNYGVSGSLTIFDGFTNLINLKMRRINKAQGKHELQNKKDIIAYETMEAFLNALYYKKAVELCEEQLRESNKQLAKMTRMKELGMKSLSDVAEAEAKQAEDEFNLTRQKNIYTIGIILLKAKMNFPIDETLAIVEMTDERMITRAAESPFAIYNNALSILPEAVVAQSEVKIKKHAYSAAVGGLFPTISINGGYSTSFYRVMDGSSYDSYRKQLANKQGQYVSFTLSVPFFNGFRNTANIKRSKANMLIAQSDRDETLRKIYSDIEQAVADMNGQVDEYTQALKQIKAMSVAHNINIKKYEEGLVSPIELSTSANRLLKSRADGVNALYKYYLKSKLVDYYKGIPYLN